MREAVGSRLDSYWSTLVPSQVHLRVWAGEGTISQPSWNALPKVISPEYGLGPPGRALGLPFLYVLPPGMSPMPWQTSFVSPPKPPHPIAPWRKTSRDPPPCLLGPSYPPRVSSLPLAVQMAFEILDRAMCRARVLKVGCDRVCNVKNRVVTKPVSTQSSNHASSNTRRPFILLHRFESAPSTFPLRLRIPSQLLRICVHCIICSHTQSRWL